ncbi:MAG: hypothetical protein IPH89_14195 [Bacteroidetes bacterium]|nr:hypothetical protein [Bacteroidota bacterium]
MIKVILHSGKDHSVKRFHPWVFSGAIKKISLPPDYPKDDLSEGDVVEVYTSQNEFLGMGHYQIGSIAIRMFSFTPVTPDYNFWKSKIQKAYDFRTQLNLTNNPSTNCTVCFLVKAMDCLVSLLIITMALLFFNRTPLECI